MTDFAVWAECGACYQVPRSVGAEKEQPPSKRGKPGELASLKPSNLPTWVHG